MKNQPITVFEITMDGYSNKMITNDKGLAMKAIKDLLEFTGRTIIIKSYKMQKSTYDFLEKFEEWEV